ncbi:hypothetical protein V6N13_126520 [Hibiscus sabdariffa]
MDILRRFVNEAENETCSRNTTLKFQRQNGVQVVIQPITNRNTGNVHGKLRARAGVDENMVLCELKYEGYCIWHEENREAMQDFMGKELKNQLFVVMVYYPSVLKIPIQNKLSGELKQNIQEFEHVFGKSTIDSDLSREIRKKSQGMEATRARFNLVTLDCNDVDKKFGQIFDLIEGESNFHLKQSALLYQLVVQTMSKSLHYVSTRLTLKYFRNHLFDKELCGKFSDLTLQHYEFVHQYYLINNEKILTLEYREFTAKIACVDAQVPKDNVVENGNNQDIEAKGSSIYIKVLLLDETL